MSLQNMPFTQDYNAASVQVTTTPQRLSTLIEAIRGIAAGSLQAAWREITVQIDPVTSGNSTILFGNQNVGATINGVVQSGMTLSGSGVSPGGGIANTTRGVVANVPLSAIWVVALAAPVSGAENIVNVQAWTY